MKDAAGIGRFNNDAYDDIAFVSGTNDNVTIYYGAASVDTTPDVTLSSPGVQLDLLQVRGVGDVNGDGWDDMAATSPAASWLVLGASVTGVTAFNDTLKDVQGRLFIPLGDINGDGYSDLGALALEQSPDIEQNGGILVHTVGQVILGHQTWTAASFAVPDLVFELDNPSYQDQSGALIAGHYFAGIGNFNNDSRDHDGNSGTAEIDLDDLAVAETLGAKVHLYYGEALARYAAPEEAVPDKPLPREFVFDLAKPNMGGAASTAYTGIDLEDNDQVAGLDLHDAYALEGSALDEQLSVAQSIGDFDGDGQDDLLVSGAEKSYIFLGPVSLSGLSLVTTAADFIIDWASLGRPADRMGDLDADGKSDLAFIRHDAGRTVITVILGGRVMPRTIDLSSLYPLYTRTIELEDSLFNNAGDISVMIANWSGHVDVQTGRVFNDLVALSSLPGITNSYGYVFSGDGIKATTVTIGAGDALVDLKLFTNTVSVATGRVPVRLPNLDSFTSEQAVTIAPVHTFVGGAGAITDATQTMHGIGTGDVVSTTQAAGNGLSAIFYDGIGVGQSSTVSAANYSNYSIYDYSVTTSSVYLSAPGATSFSVYVDIQHSYQGDLVVYIIEPDGTWNNIWNRAGGGTDNIIGTWTISGVAQTSGSWQLYVRDDAGADTGYINTFQVSAEVGSSQVWSGTVATVNNDWGSSYRWQSQPSNGGTDTTDNYDTFSEKWSGYVTPKVAGVYQFATVTDDGVRLYVDTDDNGSNELVINNWTDHGSTWDYSGSYTLAFGSYYYIEMQHYENGGGAVAQLWWNGPGTNGWQIVPQENLFTADQGSSKPVYILDNTTVESTIAITTATDVDYNYPIKDVTVRIDDLRHTYIGDLIVSLVAPDGRSFVLHNRTGGGTDNILNTSYTSSNVPSLSLLAGSSVLGNWKLRITDYAGNDQGWLKQWSLIFSVAEDVEQVTQYTLGFGDTNVSDPDHVYGNITDVNVRLNVDQARISDLKIELLHPDGTTRITLFDRQGGLGADLLNTVFDAGAGLSITSGSAPFEGAYRPVGSLDTFSDSTLDPNGTWTLIVTDYKHDSDATVDSLVSWSLDIRTDEYIKSEITVSGLTSEDDTVSLSDVNVRLAVTHPVTNDLKFWLTAPNGTQQQLLNTNSGRSLTNAVFDDELEGTDVILHTSGGFFGRSGANLNGAWKLEVVDTTGNYAGTINSWGLDIGTTPIVSEIDVANLPDGLRDLNVTVTLADDPANGYTFDLSDYTLALRGPDGTTVTLFAQTELALSALGNIVLGATFDDEAPVSIITDGDAPYTSTYKAKGLLSDFDGKNPNGTWQLAATDHTGETVGLITDWSLTFSFEPEDAQSISATVGGDVNGDGLDVLLIGVQGCMVVP
ncbi:proprotein convertase P-domain-containing protein, partial [Candidatus Aquicultor sp.]